MAIVGLKLDAEHEYQSKFDSLRGKEGATVFILGTLDGRLQARLRDKSVAMRQDPENPDSFVTGFTPNEAAVEYVKYGLKGWRSFKDSDGNDIEFQTVKNAVGGTMRVVVSDRCLALLPGDLIQELAQEIRRLNSLSEDEKGNSAGS